MKTFQLIIYIIGFSLQSFAIFFGIYLFNKQKINTKQYILASIIMSFVSVIVRLLPISLGVHTIVNMLFTYLICVILIKMPAYITIRSTSLCVVLIIICELTVSSTAIAVKGRDYFENILDNPLQKSIIGIIANLMYSFIVVFLYFMFKKKGGNYRDISSKDCK